MPLKPPKYVNPVRRLIYWQYAQLIAKAAGFEGNYGVTVQPMDKGPKIFHTETQRHRDFL
ncbi:MAG: hypothetical protein Kow0063_43060 [Anaerolineae bacterium]